MSKTLTCPLRSSLLPIQYPMNPNNNNPLPFYEEIRRYFVRICGSTNADDFVQTVYCRFTKYKPDLEGQPLLNWLYCTARHLYIDQLRSKQPKVTASGDVETIVINAQDEHADDPAAVVEEQEQIKKLISILDSLNGTLKGNLIRLRFYEDKSFSEIGKEVGMSTSAARNQIMRLIKELSKEFKESDDVG